MSDPVQTYLLRIGIDRDAIRRAGSVEAALLAHYKNRSLAEDLARHPDLIEPLFRRLGGRYKRLIQKRQP